MSNPPASTDPSSSLPTHVVTTLFHNEPLRDTSSTAPQDDTGADSRPRSITELLAVLAEILGSDSLTKNSQWRNLTTNAPAETCPVHELIFSPSSQSALTLSTLRSHPLLQTFQQTHSVNLSLLPSISPDPSKTRSTTLRLALFDMDSTLIQQETIDELASLLSLKPQISHITSLAMNGALDFEQSLRQRCALLAGCPTTVWRDLQTTNGAITITPGARELVKVLRRLGVKTAVVSGGFVPMASWLKDQLGLDYAFANTLAVSEDGSKLTGEVEGPVVHAEKKNALLFELAEKEGLGKSVQGLECTMAVGDGANDLPMLRAAGLGVAFNAKPVVQVEAPARVNRSSLRDVLFLLGLSWEEQEELLREA